MFYLNRKNQMKKKRTKKENSDSELYGSVTVGTKGQFVIPIEARNKFNIKTGDQLLVFGNNKSKVLAVIKADEITELIGDITKLNI